ncbi:MAG TPA: hypothetical protein VHX38_19540 [Pseudonocardiaceae bacterium]|jgi:pimeloyl-ACP methyl ester carboxylesterase|nr:hypothetical protein [Pseudonocardiaceae bacterium]
MTSSPWWAEMCSVAPTLVYDLSAVHEVNMDTDWKARWAEVTVPAVVFSGDQTFPGMPAAADAAAADAVAAALPNATRQVMPGQGHSPATEAIVPVLVSLLRP